MLRRAPSDVFEYLTELDDRIVTVLVVIVLFIANNAISYISLYGSWYILKPAWTNGLSGFWVPTYLFIAKILVIIGLLYYLRTADAPDIGIDYPDVRDLGLTIGVIGLYILVIFPAIASILEIIDPPSGSHWVSEYGSQNPSKRILLLPITILLAPLVEELVYRGTIQGRLRRNFGPIVSITGVSLLFAIAHIDTLQGLGGTSVLVVLLNITPAFSISVVLGWVYEHTNNILMPALAHGAVNGFPHLLTFL